MQEPLDALIVSDRTEHVKTMVRILDGLPIKAYAACTLKQAEQVLSRQPISVIFCDERLPGGSYRRLLSARASAKRRSESCFVVTLQTGEWEEPEPPGDDQPEATWVLAGRPGPDGGPDPDAIELRSDLARHLDRATFPANRAHLMDTLASRNAPDQLTELVSGLPARTKFTGLPDVIRRLGLPVESRPT